MSRRIGRRSIAVLLAALLVFTTVPVSANAAEAVDVAEVVDAAGEVAEEASDESQTEAVEEVLEEDDGEKDGSFYDTEEQEPKSEESSESETEQTEGQTDKDALDEDETSASKDSEEMTETEDDADNTVTEEGKEEAIEDAESENESEIVEEPEIAEYNIDARSVVGDDYPTKYKNYALDAVVDEWNFYNRECTSFAAWRLNSQNGVAFHNYYANVHWGNAKNWGNAAQSVGITVNNSPSVGSIWWSSAGTYGHVAWVAEVNGDQVTIEEYNYGYAGNYGTRILSASSATGYIHIKDINQTPAPTPIDRVKGSYMDIGYSRVIPDGYYHIASSFGDQWWLVIEGISDIEGANVELWDYSIRDFECDEQLFYFEFIDEGGGRGFYKITNKKSGKCLDVAGASEYMYDENGNPTNVRQWTDNGSPAQQWAIREVDGGEKGILYTLQARCSGFCLDLYLGESSLINGANISMHIDNETPAQQWRLVPYAPAVGQTIEDGEYQIVYHAAENKALGAAENVNGANVQLSSSYKGDYWQTYDVKYLGNGYYSIINKDSGLSLDVAGAYRVIGGNVWLWNSMDYDAQKWIIQPCGNGSYNIISKCNGLYLHLDGANINMWNWRTDNTIKWKFVPYVQSKLQTPTATLSNAAEVDAGTKFYLNKNGAETIYYTWDGTTPTKQSTEYSDSTGLTIPTGQATCTLKAFGVKEGYQDSDILEMTYTVKQKKPSGEEGGDTNPEDDDLQDGVKWHYNEQNVAYKDLSQYGQIVTNIKPKIYDGTPYKPAVKVTAIENGKTVTLTEGPDYRVLYYNNIHAGTGSVTIKGNGVYKGTISKKFEIKKKSCKKLKVITNSMLTGDSSTPKIYVYDGSTLLIENKDYTLDGITPNFTARKGTKQISVIAARDSDYEGITSAKITVYDADKGRIKGIIDKPENVKLSQSTYQYTGKACKPTAVVTVDGKTLTAGKDYTIKYQNNKDAGTASATITGKGSYVGSVVKEFTIKASNGEFTLKKPIAAVTYNGKLQKPKIAIKVDGKTLKLNKDYTLSYTNNLQATDRARVTVRGKGNYADVSAKVFYFTINPCHIKKASVKGGQGGLFITHAKHTLVEGVDYDVIYGDVVGKGKILMTIKAKEGSSFTGEVTKKMKQ